MIYNPFHEKSLPFPNRPSESLNKVSSNDRGSSVWVTVSGRCLEEDKRDKAHSVWAFSSSLLSTASQYGLNVCRASLVSLQTAGCFWALKRIQQPLNNIRYGDHGNRNEWESECWGGPLAGQQGSGASLFPEERMPVTQTGRDDSPMPFRNHPVIENRNQVKTKLKICEIRKPCNDSMRKWAEHKLSPPPTSKCWEHELDMNHNEDHKTTGVISSRDIQIILSSKLRSIHNLIRPQRTCYGSMSSRSLVTRRATKTQS